MTGLEVWEAWKENPKKKFEVNGNVIILGELEIPIWEDVSSLEDNSVSIRAFMETDWKPADEWKEVKVLEAVEAFLYRDKTIKRTHNSKDELFNLKDGDILGIDVFSEVYTWYIKE